jgi:Tfp pilus assembly protein PilZ
MSRRTAERYSRRVEVRFWRRGHDQPHSGFTIDLSRTGMFLGTSMSLDPGERLRLEIVDRERGFMIEGQVARVHRVSLALRHVEQPGVGVRFFGPGDLVSELIGGGRQKPASVVDRGSAAEASAPSLAPERPPAADHSVDDLFGPDPNAPARPAERPAGASPEAAPPVPRPGRKVPVEFVDRASFLSVYHRDIAAGGLFVTTDAPADLHEVVLVDLRLPMPTAQPMQFEARVVHRFDPKAGGKPGLTGMGVQFLDPERVRFALAPLVAESRG